MSIVVQKFGGTSLHNANTQDLLLSQVKQTKEEGHDLVLVVSAMGRFGDPYATDTLVSMLDDSNGKLNPKNKDLIMSCGEIISSSIISHLLNIHGIESEALTGLQAGILTDDNFNDAKILNIDTSKIYKILEAGKVAVVAGFQGANSQMDITTLGRGGSDITAVTLAGFLGAERVDIFTDVPSISVIDPKIISNPTHIRNINYSTMYNYASYGAKVIHPEAVLVAQKYNIPIHVGRALLHDTRTIISNYQEVNKKIIGLGMGIQDDFGYISVFLDSNNSELKEKVKSCISLNEDLNRGAKWFGNYLIIYVDSDKVLELTRKAYDCFKTNGLI